MSALLHSFISRGRGIPNLAATSAVEDVSVAKPRREEPCWHPASAAAAPGFGNLALYGAFGEPALRGWVPEPER